VFVDRLSGAQARMLPHDGTTLATAVGAGKQENRDASTPFVTQSDDLDDACRRAAAARIQRSGLGASRR
jgi:hypothetical protein